MAVKKLAISLPEDVLEQVDAAARERGLPRSTFIAQVLERVARARRDAEITRQLDELFSDPDLDHEQRATAAAFGRAADRGGTEW